MTKSTRLVFGDHRDPQEELIGLFKTLDAAIAWANSQVDTKAATQLEAIRKLRHAQPALGLKSAPILPVCFSIS